jgi:chemotaxis protein MotA
MLHGALLAWGALIVLNIIEINLPDLLKPLNLPSLAIVLGGIGIHVMITYPMTDYLKSWIALPRIFSHVTSVAKTAEIDLARLIDWQKQLISAHNPAEELSQKLNGSFEGYVFTLIASGYSIEQIRMMAEVRAATLHRSRIDTSQVLYTMSNAAPAFGMLGTLFGLILILTNFQQATELTKELSVAVMTTVYGLILAQMIFLPMAQKMHKIAWHEFDRQMLLLDGILHINSNSSVLELHERFKAYTMQQAPDSELSAPHFGHKYQESFVHE